jgi:UDP-2-acetamido-2,6-beta-L-arabino-hexul-4-ose reductase
MNVVVTGAHGFLGRNLTTKLGYQTDITIFEVTRSTADDELVQMLGAADLVYHLAGANRPVSVSDFQTVNADFTARVCTVLLSSGRPTPIVLASSIQAAHDNPYGGSKRAAEEHVITYAATSGASAPIYRLKNVFGKWCRPNYNSVVATFCYNAARGLPLVVSDPYKTLELIYVDDTINAFLSELHAVKTPGHAYREVEPVYSIALGELAAEVSRFRDMRRSLSLPEMDDWTRKLYATYLSYLEKDDFAYGLQKRCDERGCLAEFVKSTGFGQIFISRTLPGVTRGNHYHHTKVEKFLVAEGEAMIRFRPIQEGEVIEYRVRGEDFKVLDIPPGYTHSIENVGSTELITLFWASEVFDPSAPDTRMLPVLE